MNKGRVVSVTGPVVDIEFERGQLPDVLNAIKIEAKGDGRGPDINLTLEVALHLGDNLVRTIAMTSTDGLVRGMEAVDLGGPITVPVGAPTLGRVFNVLGEPIDEAGEVVAESNCRFTVRRRHSRSCRRRRKFSRPASRSSTCSRLTPRAARSACSAARASARRS